MNLIFHEAGQVLFALLGNNILITLGGRLNQMLIPCIAFTDFYYKRDRIGTAFALLWFFGDFIDVSIYMADGRFLKLSLILGMGIKVHYWLNLFNHFNLWGIYQMLWSMIFYLGWASLFLVWAWLCKSWRSYYNKV